MNLLFIIHGIDNDIGYHVSEFDTEYVYFNGTYTDVCKIFVEASNIIKNFNYES